jgi:hypothetical protein
MQAILIQPWTKFERKIALLMGKTAGGWRVSLGKIIRENNGRETDGSTASFPTQAMRKEVLTKSFETLREAGYKLNDVRGFGSRHMNKLAELWKSQGLSAITLQSNTSVMRTFAEWINKPGMVKSSSHYFGELAAVEHQQDGYSEQSRETPSNPSRRAIARVKNPLPAPTVCPFCSGDVAVAHHNEIYGRAYGEWPWVYLCKSCRAYVGMYPLTNIPLGTLADAKLRNARKLGKKPFEALWDGGGMTRTEAYAALAAHMGKTEADCHFGWFSIEECRIAYRWAIEKLRNAAAHLTTKI